LHTVPNSNNRDFLQKKRKIQNTKNNNNLSKNLASTNNQIPWKDTIGVKLICDSNNEELKDYLSKTV
jgi:hypothetical protein